MSSTATLISFELYPVQESTALHTLFETIVTPASDNTFTPQQTRLSCDLMPLPSPQPTPAQVHIFTQSYAMHSDINIRIIQLVFTH